MSAVVGTPLRRLVGPTLITCVMLAILVGLGVWQVERLHWKLGLLAQIDHAEAAPPEPLRGVPDQFTKVSATGVLRSDLRAYYGYDVHGTTEGSQLIEPLDRPGQDPVLVNLGWVPEGFSTPIVRLRDDLGLCPECLPSRACSRRRQTSPPSGISGQPRPGGDRRRTRPRPRRAVHRRGPWGTGGSPEPVSALPRPPNDHLGYAHHLVRAGCRRCLVTYALFVRQGPMPRRTRASDDRLFQPRRTASAASPLWARPVRDARHWDAVGDDAGRRRRKARGDQLAVLAGLGHAHADRVRSRRRAGCGRGRCASPRASGSRTPTCA